MSVTPFLNVNHIQSMIPMDQKNTTLHNGVVRATILAATQALIISCSNLIILSKGKVLNIDWERQHLL